MQRLEVSGAVRPIYGLLGVKRLILELMVGTEHGSAAVFRDVNPAVTCAAERP